MFIHCWDIWRNRCYVLPFFWLCKVQFIYSINSLWMEEGLRLQNKSELFAVLQQRTATASVPIKNLMGTDVDVCLCGFHIWKDENSLTSLTTVRICMTQWHCTYLLCLLSLLHAAVSVYARMCACLLRSEEQGCVSLQGFGLRLHVSREDEHYTPLICLISPTIHTSANPPLSPFLTFPLYLLIKSTTSLISQIFSSVYPWLLLCSCLLLKIMHRGIKFFFALVAIIIIRWMIIWV